MPRPSVHADTLQPVSAARILLGCAFADKAAHEEKDPGARGSVVVPFWDYLTGSYIYTHKKELPIVSILVAFWGYLLGSLV